MPLTLEQEAELLPLAERVIDLMPHLILEEEKAPEERKYDKEFQEITEKISKISPNFLSRLCLKLYECIPNLKGQVLEYVKNNI